MATKQERGTLASIPKSLHIVHGTWSTPDLLMKQDPQMERELPSKCIVARSSNGQTRPGQRLALFFLALPPRNRTKARKFLSPVWRFQSCLFFDPLITGTGKLFFER